MLIYIYFNDLVWYTIILTTCYSYPQTRIHHQESATSYCTRILHEMRSKY